LSLAPSKPGAKTSKVARLWRIAGGGAAVSLASLYLGVLCTLGLNFFAGWWFGGEAFGEIAVGLSVILICSMMCQLGFSHGVVKLIGAYRATGEDALLRGAMRGTVGLCLAASAAVTVVGYFCLLLPMPLDPGVRSALQWAFVCIPVWTLLLLVQNIARGFQRMGLANLPSTVFHPLALIDALLLLPDGPYRTAAFFFQAYGLLALATLLGLVLWMGALPEIRAIAHVRPVYATRAWLKMSIPILFSVGQNQLLQRGDVLILALFVAKQEVGWYALASRVTLSVANCKLAFNRHYAAAMAAKHALGDHERLQYIVRRTSRLSLAVSVSIAAVLILFGKPILGLAGEDFTRAYPLMFILLVGNLFTAYYAANIVLLQMADQECIATALYTVTSICVVAGYFLIVPWAGAMGAATVTSAGMVLLTWLMSRACKKHLNCASGAF
jgi:O-antigen/teichoic acid export membrane protein